MYAYVSATCSGCHCFQQRINALMCCDSSLRKYTQQMSVNVIIDKFSI